MEDPATTSRRATTKRARRPRSAPPDRNLRTILEAQADGVVIVDADGVVRFANPAAQAIFAHRPGDQAASLVGTEFGFPLVAGQTTEVDLVRPRGDAAVAEIRAVEVEWDGQMAYLASLRDVTERKHAEAERARRLAAEAARAEAEAAVRARDEFIGVLAHELKTPLARLVLAAERLERHLQRDGPSDTEQMRRAVELQRQQARRLSRIVSQFFDMSLIQQNALRLRRSTVDVRGLVERAVAAASAETAHHQVITRLPHGPLPALADPERLAQVVTYLIDNAVRFSPDGGPIEVELAPVPATGAGAVDEAAQRAHASRPELDREMVRLTIRDHGVGIPPAHRPHIFDRYYQAHRSGYLSGIGVGLYVCRGIVELHGGQIDAQFPEDGGACFVVTIPRRQEQILPTGSGIWARLR